MNVTKMSDSDNKGPIVDPKIYIIFIFFGLILLSYSIFEIKFVTVDINDFLGLTSRLTLAYWTGFVLIIAISIRLYIDNEIENDGIYVICLIIIGLFLFAIPIFAEENARFTWSYYPAGEIKEILKTYKIDNISTTELGSYRSWPITHLFSAFVINIVNIDTDDLIKYMPLFWILTTIFITYYTGKLFKLSRNQCFMASFFVITSFWTINYYYGPQSIAHTLYLLFFVSIMTIYKRNDVASVIFMTLLFIASIMTHMLTSIVIISSFLFSSRSIQFLYKHRLKFMVTFVTIFIAWYLYVAVVMLEVGVDDFIKQMSNEQLFDVFKGEKYNVGDSPMRQIIHYSRLSYLGIYAILMIVSIVLYIKGKVRNDSAELVKICFLWLIGTSVLLVLRYGAEIDDRVYILSLLPMALIIVMTYDRKTIAILAILFVTLHIPAHYGTESYDMVQTPDLLGSEFIAPRIGPYDSINYYFTPLIRYYNSQFVNGAGFKFGYYNPDNSSLDNSTYIISSRQLNSYLLYVFGTDSIQNWLQTRDDRVMLLYENGYYSIYRNNGIKKVQA